MNLYIHKTIKPHCCQMVRVHFLLCQTCRAGVTPTTMFVYILVVVVVVEQEDESEYAKA